MNTYVHQYRLIVTSVLVLCLAGAALAANPILTLSGSESKPLAAPCVAFNTTDGLYLSAFEFHYGATDWDIDGRLVDPNGQLVGEGLAIAWYGSIVQQEADVAYNPVTNQFLVVYALAPDNWKISACIVAGDGTPGPFVPIATSTFKEYHPEVACDPTTGEYLVVYEREQQLDSTVWREVWAQRVLSDGTLIGEPYRLSNPSFHSHQCAIACAGGQFLVVWREQQTSGKGRVLGRIIQCWYPSKTTIVVASAKDSASPKVVYNPLRAEYLVVYQTRTSSSARWVLEGTRVNTLGGLNGTHTITKATATDEHCQVPDVACDWADGQYIVTWAQGPAVVNPSLASHQIWAQRLESNGEPVDSPIPISGPGKSQPVNPGIPAPAIAMGFCSKALIVWEDQTFVLDPDGPSTTIYSILGSHGNWGSPCGVPDCNSVE
jgi:hypothetical protein